MAPDYHHLIIDKQELGVQRPISGSIGPNPYTAATQKPRERIIPIESGFGQGDLREDPADLDTTPGCVGECVSDEANVTIVIIGWMGIGDELGEIDRAACATHGGEDVATVLGVWQESEVVCAQQWAAFGTHCFCARSCPSTRRALLRRAVSAPIKRRSCNHSEVRAASSP